jgi:macrolide transport system ATP-binding/permease protein
MMAGNPGFVAAAVVSLALAIGPNTMIFSLINALLLRPLPVDHPDRLVRVFRSDHPNSYHSISYPDFLDYRDRQQVFTSLAACQSMMMSLHLDSRPEPVLGAVASANFFSTLGVQPSMGRGFAPDKDRNGEGHPVAVISHGLWQRRFNADPSMLGGRLRLNGRDFTVIGIAARGFTGIDQALVIDVWVPIAMYPQLIPSGARSLDPVNGREEAWINNVIGRLKPGVSLEQAQSSLNGISAQLEGDYPSRQTEPRRGVALFPISKGHPELRATILPFGALLMTVAGLALLIACANVASLLLMRAAARHKEIAIRLAIGANRRRLTMQLLTESVALALMGGVLGVLMAYWASDWLLAFKPSVSIPMTIDLSLDRRVLGFSLIISFLTGIVFGLIPALNSSNPDLVPALKAEAGAFGRYYRESRLQRLLVIAQMALSLVLLIGASLIFRSMRNASQVDPGFEKKNLMLLSTDLDLRGFTASEGRRFYRRLIDRMQTFPGQRACSLTSIFPLSMASSETTVAIEGRESSAANGETVVGSVEVAPGYFETMKIPLLQGREFSAHDEENGPRVTIINQTMANRFWPGENPIGKRIKVGPLTPGSRDYEVIGVAKDSRFLTLGESPQPFMYQSLLQQYNPNITLVVRTDSDPAGMLTALRREVQSLDEDLLVYDVKMVTDHLAISLLPLRMASSLLGALGALALLLASVGLYAVVAYSVALRKREIGIRMALGARPAQVLKAVLFQGAILALIGILIGLVLAFAIARAMSSLGLLYGISAIDPATFSGVPLLLISVAVLASYVPAFRAMKIDPVLALRQ